MDSSTFDEVEQQEKNDSSEQTKIITTFTDSLLYKAAAKGQIDSFNACTEPLDLLLAPIKNTILHIHITHQIPSVPFLDQILATCPSLLLQANNKGETPLHMAARHGHAAAVVIFLIASAKVQHEDIEIGAAEDAKYTPGNRFT
ncbi:hypothetical protein M5689_005926 [Euphorbia peplus]|nr:hypothetical protein M5689_005926 [Euphorbia peplus]